MEAHQGRVFFLTALRANQASAAGYVRNWMFFPFFSGQVCKPYEQVCSAPPPQRLSIHIPARCRVIRL